MSSAASRVTDASHELLQLGWVKLHFSSSAVAPALLLAVAAFDLSSCELNDQA